MGEEEALIIQLPTLNIEQRAPSIQHPAQTVFAQIVVYFDREV